LPKDFSALAMVYSSQAFSERRGQRRPNHWDELSAAAKTLKTKPARLKSASQPNRARARFPLRRGREGHQATNGTKDRDRFA